MKKSIITSLIILLVSVTSMAAQDKSNIVKRLLSEDSAVRKECIAELKNKLANQTAY